MGHEEAPALVLNLFTALCYSWTGHLDDEALWRAIDPQPGACIHCMVGYHALQQDLAARGCSVAAECLLLRAACRLEALFCALNSSFRCAPQESPANLLLPQHLYAMLETLQYDHLLKDGGAPPPHDGAVPSLRRDPP